MSSIRSIYGKIQVTIRAARINAGYSPREVRKATGISAARLENIERNCGKVSWTTALKLARLYRLTLDDIWWGSEDEFHARIKSV